MSKTEKDLVAQITELPADIQDKFLLMAQGAVVALDAMAAAREAAAAGTGTPSGPCATEDGGAA